MSVRYMAETTFTEMDLCHLVEKTLDKVISPDMPPEVQKALHRFAMQLLDEAAQPGRERREQMKREVEERLSRLRARLSDGGPAAI